MDKDMSTLPNIEFSILFKELLMQSKYRKCSLVEIGKAFGVSGSMVHYYKKGDKLPSISTSIGISKKLDCSIDYLLTGRGPMRVASANKMIFMHDQKHRTVKEESTLDVALAFIGLAGCFCFIAGVTILYIANLCAV